MLSYSLFLNSIAFARIETTNSKEEVIAIMEKLRQVDRLLEVENLGLRLAYKPGDTQAVARFQ